MGDNILSQGNHLKIIAHHSIIHLNLLRNLFLLSKNLFTIAIGREDSYYI